MSIGYACLTVGVPNTGMKNCLIKNASEAKLAELIEHNLNALENIVDYNITNGIKLFRISSDIIPFGSNPVNQLPWPELFEAQLRRIGDKIKVNNIRVSMHPGQYTVLNSLDIHVVRRAIDDLRYHAQFLDSLGTNLTNKIVLHVGGVYGDKRAAMERFVLHFSDLNNSIKRRLVIENDDKSYHIGDVLALSTRLGLPVVYDNLHNLINPADQAKDDYYWISQCAKTWQPADGPQKIHYAQQNKLKKAGSHSGTISIHQFMAFYANLDEQKPDIMLEVKDKNLSAVKCINCTTGDQRIKSLEVEWSRYKYQVLEHSPTTYNQIRKLLANKDDYPSVAFYSFIEHGIERETTLGNSVNAALHIWGYFKDLATEKEKAEFLKSIESYKAGDKSIAMIKRLLWNMADRYKRGYLLSSYYFTS